MSQPELFQQYLGFLSLTNITSPLQEMKGKYYLHLKGCYC